MKLLLVIATLFSIQFANADTNETCKFIYREGIEHLKTDFNNYSIGADSKAELALNLARTSSVVRGTRAYCVLFETAENNYCVSKYSEIYQDLRSQVKILSLLTGNQEDIAKKNIANRFKQAVQLKAIDIRCGYNR